MSGLTYAFGRTDNDTTESGTLITRVAGQFTSPFTACPVRVASTHRQRLTVSSSQITPTTGAVGIYFTPDNNYGGPSQPATGVMWSWYTDANNYIELVYNKAATRWELRRYAAGAGSTITTIDTTFAAGVGRFIYMQWDATTIGLSVAGSAVTSTANTNIPTLPTTVDIGSRAAASDFEARYDAVLCCSAALTATQIAQFNALVASRPPLFGEFVNETMTLLWYGANSRYWTLAAGGKTVDLLGQTGVKISTINGMGVPAMEHRNVETPLRDGASYIDSRMRTRSIRLGARVYGHSAATFQTARRALLSKLNPRLGQGILMYAPDAQCYEVDAVVDEFSLSDHQANVPRLQTPNIAFKCFDPAIRVSALNETLQTVPAGGWSIPWSIPWSITQSAVTFNFTNDGDVDAWPRFSLTAAVASTGPYFTNNTTGKTFALTGGGVLSMAAADVLLVDMLNRTATIAGANKYSYRSDASQMWPLVPGVNSVTIGVATGSAEALMRSFRQLIGV